MSNTQQSSKAIEKPKEAPTKTQKALKIKKKLSNQFDHQVGIQKTKPPGPEKKIKN